MLNKLKSLLSRKDPLHDAAFLLYGRLVGQARQPAFYAELGVPDDVDGRFEMIILHAFVAMRRLKGLSEPAGRFSQQLFDVMFMDMDRSLREMGVSDVSIGKHIKRMMRGFYGRVGAYEDGLDGGTGLGAALERNLYGTVSAAPEHLERLENYVRTLDRAFKQCDLAAVMEGRIDFPQP